MTQEILTTLVLIGMFVFMIFVYLLAVNGPRNVNARIDKLEKGVSNEVGRQFDYVKDLERNTLRSLKKLKKTRKKLYCFELIAPDDNGDLIITLDSANVGMFFHDQATATITGEFVLECMTPMGNTDVQVEIYRYKDRMQIAEFGDFKTEK